MAAREGLATPDPSRGLVVWASGSAARARERHLQGAEVVTWKGASASPLERAGVPFRRIEDVIGAEGLAAADAAGRAWARVWGRLPLVEGRSFRDLVEWREVSLLWTAEAFLRERTAGPHLARTADLCLRLFEAVAPTEVDAVGLAPADALLLARAAGTVGVLFHDPPASARPLRRQAPPSRSGLLTALGRILSSDSPPPAPAAYVGAGGGSPLLVLGASPADAGSIRPLLEAVAAELGMPSLVLPTAEISRWTTRRARHATAEAAAGLRARLASLRGTPALLLSYTHRGVRFADLAAKDLEALLLGHLPTMVGLLEDSIELVSAIRPALVLLMLSGRDERRTLLLAARAAGVPAIVLRTGPTEPIDAFRQDGGPRPAAQIAWEPGAGTQEAVTRLREVAHGRVKAE